MARNLLLLLLALFILQSCCYKEDCIMPVEEEIKFRVNTDVNNKGFSEAELSDMRVMVINPASGQVVVDSIHLSRQDRFDFAHDPEEGVFSINEMILRRVGQTTLGANIVITNVQGTFADTLHNINFETQTLEYTCGSCLFNPDTRSEPFIANRSYTHKGQLFTEKIGWALISKP